MNYQLAMVRLTVASLGIRHAAGFVRPAAVSRWGAASASSPVLSRLASTAAPESTSSPEETAAAMVAKLCIDHPNNNVPTHIAELVGRDLHLQPNHPIGIVRKKIQDYFTTLDTKFEIFNGEDPIVTAEQCFDDLRIPPDHPGRQPSDTYYVTDTTLLRTHTSAHQSQHLRAGCEAFLCTGDVYRRDEIDRSHFPAFHQMEGVKLWPKDTPGLPGVIDREEWVKTDSCKMIGEDLKQTLEGMVDVLFPGVEKRWNEDYFPFTEPSFELEVFYEGAWLEVLGCGVVHTEVLSKCGLEERHGWAFGLGLERLAMVLFKIPDIRLFWSNDSRFTKQFAKGEVTTFKPYSKYPPCYKDIAFWLPEDGSFVANDFFELARGIGGDLIEQIEEIDSFTHPKTNKQSNCYRVTYRSMERSLTDDEINVLQDTLRDDAAGKLSVELR